MSTITIDGRQSLAKVVSEIFEKGKFKLESGESLSVTVYERTGRVREINIPRICRPVKSNRKLDAILSSDVESLDLGYCRRYEVLHRAGFHCVGQLVRTFRELKRIKGFTKPMLARIRCALIEKGLDENDIFGPQPCGPRELKKIRTIPIHDFLLEVKKLIAFRNASILEVNHGCEELSCLGMHTLGDCLDAGYEKVREALIKVAERDGPWFSSTHEGCPDYFNGFVGILARFSLKLERKISIEEKEELQEPEPLPKNLQGHSFHF